VTSCESASLRRKSSRPRPGIHELESNVSQLTVGDPERIGGHKLIWRLMEARTAAWRTLSDLVEGVELRPMQH
jgi:hypothetical protein